MDLFVRYFLDVNPPRTHRSIVPAFAMLRDAVCPQRAYGRVLFVSAADDGSTAS